MTVVVKTIGTGKNHTTPQLWVAGFTSGGNYSNGDYADGQMYAETFTGALTVSNPGSITLIGYTLGPAAGEEHDGTRGTGPILDNNGSSSVGIQNQYGAVDGIYRFFEMDTGKFGFSTSAATKDVRFLNNLVYGDFSSTPMRGILLSTAATSGYIYVENCQVFDYASSGTASVHGIWNTADYSKVMNNTVVGMVAADNVSSYAYGYYSNTSSATALIKNNICMGQDAGAGTTYDFQFAGSNVHDYNMSEDTTANGTNSLISKTTTDQFVSVTVGSEDLHLKAGADAIDAGTDLTSEDSGYVEYDIDGVARTGTWAIGSDQMLGPQSKTIGTTARDYATYTLFEAAVIAWADVVVTGTAYADSTFDEDVTFNDNTPSEIDVTVAESDRHDGTAGSGVVINRSTSGSNIINLANNTTCDTTFGWVELTTSVAKVHPGNRTVGVHCDSGGGGEYRHVHHCLIHGLHNSYDGGTGTVIGIRGNSNNREYIFLNNIIYDFSTNGTATSGVAGINFGATGAATYCQNNTIYKGHVDYSSATGNSNGITCNDNANASMQNNIVCDFTNDGSGSAACFATASYSSATVDHNLSSDTSASGTGSKVSKTAVAQFVSITEGMEDLHIIDTSDAVDAGIDLGTTNGVNIDADGFDRDDSGVTWDIGAFEYGASFTIGTTARDFATYTLFEAALSAYTNKAVVGTAYNDSVFDEAVTWQDTAPASLLVTVAETDRHDGTAGTGVRNVRTGTNTVYGVYITNFTFEWSEVDCNGNQCPYIFRHQGAAGQITTIRNMIMHGISGAATSLAVITNSGDRDMTVINNIFYDCTQTGGSGLPAYMIQAHQTGPSLVANNTIYKLENDSGSGVCYGISAANDADLVLKNNIAVDTGGTTTGAKKDFNFPGSTQDSDYNMSGDSTADDDGSTHSITSVTTVTQFVSVTVGMEDLHLLNTSDALKVGVSLGTTNEVNIDINGNDRTVYSGWDIGADQTAYSPPSPPSGGDAYSLAIKKRNKNPLFLTGL